MVYFFGRLQTHHRWQAFSGHVDSHFFVGDALLVRAPETSKSVTGQMRHKKQGFKVQICFSNRKHTCLWNLPCFGVPAIWNRRGEIVFTWKLHLVRFLARKATTAKWKLQGPKGDVRNGATRTMEFHRGINGNTATPRNCWTDLGCVLFKFCSLGNLLDPFRSKNCQI